MTILLDDFFDYFKNDPRSRVFQSIPDIFADNRGFFCQKMTELGPNQLQCERNCVEWFADFSWVRQVNESHSGSGTIRGCHAQNGRFCQGKLVESIQGMIYDVITDARPDSRTFGKTKVYRLDPVRKNMLWVPRGFLHAFCTSTETGIDYIFQYFCDNVFDVRSEVGVNPMSVIPQYALTQVGQEFDGFRSLFDEQHIGHLNLSKKDQSRPSFDEFVSKLDLNWYK